MGLTKESRQSPIEGEDGDENYPTESPTSHRYPPITDAPSVATFHKTRVYQHDHRRVIPNIVERNESSSQRSPVSPSSNCPIDQWAFLDAYLRRRQDTNFIDDNMAGGKKSAKALAVEEGENTLKHIRLQSSVCANS
jgi:hypothetical protein